MSAILPVNLDDLLDCRGVESARVEFKSGWDPQTTGYQALKTICAFANDYHNLNGGYVVLGVAEEHGRGVMPPAGLTAAGIAAAGKWIRGHCNRLDPPYQPVVSPEVVAGRHILVLWAPASDVKPHSAPDGPRGTAKYWIRLGAETVDAQANGLLSQLMAQTARVPWDDRRAFDARIEAGARIDVVLFPDGPAGDTLRERVFRGGLATQLRGSLRYLESLLQTEIRKVSGRVRSLSWTNYPLRAIREALVNALYNRSYQPDAAEPTKVYCYPDRIDITSYPGPVPGIRTGPLPAGGRGAGHAGAQPTHRRVPCGAEAGRTAPDRRREDLRGDGEERLTAAPFRLRRGKNLVPHDAARAPGARRGIVMRGPTPIQGGSTCDQQHGGVFMALCSA